MARRRTRRIKKRHGGSRRYRRTYNKRVKRGGDMSELKAKLAEMQARVKEIQAEIANQEQNENLDEYLAVKPEDKFLEKEHAKNLSILGK